MFDNHNNILKIIFQMFGYILATVVNVQNPVNMANMTVKWKILQLSFSLYDMAPVN